MTVFRMIPGPATPYIWKDPKTIPVRRGYPFKTLAEIASEGVSNYISYSHWGLFKHDYSADFD